MKMREIINLVAPRALNESESEGLKTSKTMWRLSPFATLPKAVRYCEADTADEAAKILADRLAKKRWGRVAKNARSASIEQRRPPLGRLHPYTVTFTGKNGVGDAVEDVLEIVVRKSMDEFESE